MDESNELNQNKINELQSIYYITVCTLFNVPIYSVFAAQAEEMKNKILKENELINEDKNRLLSFKDFFYTTYLSNYILLKKS
jgi:hypothetical protein